MSSVDLNKLDRRVKWGVLLASMLTLALLLAAALTENVFPQWRMIRKQYARILVRKATDARGQTLAEQFELKIEQNVLPELKTVDRCQTCHPGLDDPRMAQEPRPFRKHPGDILINHPPEKFGCTICHRGQGRSLVFSEAKAEDAHWDTPLLPANLTQSACGVCHSAEEVATRGGEKYALGKQLFETKGCISCHKLEGRGGSLGPALDGVGLKVKGQLPMAGLSGPHTLPQWLTEHFDNPQKIVAGSQMRPPQLSREENEALTIYMLSLQNRDLPRSYLSPAKHLEYYKAANPDPTSGEQLYAKYCASCHDTGLFSRYDKFYGKFVPAVRGSSLAQTATTQFLDNTISQGRPGTLMPAWGAAAGGLREAEIATIRDYLLAAPIQPQAKLYPLLSQIAKDPQFVAQGDAMRGGGLYARHCAGCHGPGGAGLLAPTLANAVLQKSAGDGFLFTTIAAGRRNTAMPGFFGTKGLGFTQQDINDVVVFLRTLGRHTAAPATTPLKEKKP